VSPLVAPELFDGLEEYAASLGDGSIPIDQAVTAGSQIVAFLNAFFEQFFRNVLGEEIRNPTAEDRARAELVRHSQTLPEHEIALVKAFEDYCAWAPDIYGSEYGGYSYIYEEFHREFLRYLVEDVSAWAETTGDSELIAAARRAQDAYEAVV
jgi:hypothetical protein